MRATIATDPCAFHGEGPFWDAARQRLLLMDMLAGAVVELRTDGTLLRHELGGIAAVVRPRTRGGFVLAVEHGIRLLDADLEPVGEVQTVFDDPAIRMNEGGCDPRGRFFVGTMAYDARPGAGTLYRIDADRSAHVALRGVTISNGLQWSADGLAAFYDDTPSRRISRYDYDPDHGELGARTTLVDLPEGVGAPDGMAIDVEDGVWIALWGGGAVHRYDRRGRLTEVVELPCRNVTSCAFGGPDRTTLFITTSRDGLPEGEVEREAGAVFAVDAGVRGAVPHAWAG